MRIRLDHTRLAAFLSAKALSQNNWAMKLGLSSGHLADLVNGNHLYPSAVTREKLVAGLGVSFDELFSIEMRDAARDEAGDFQSRFQAAVTGRYIIDAIVGQGGMGTVYLARDVKHGRPVAIKVVLPDAISVLGNAQFLKEIRRTPGLQHPNILPLLDSGEAAECPYLVAPYVKRGSLRRLLDERGRLTARETLELMRGICAGLAYAHEERLVHCDIKPDNVLYSGGQAVIADFGISRAVHLDGRMREPGIDTSSGTPAYVSPEQATGDVIDSSSDQYSAACLAYELMAGQPPFSGDNAMAIVSRRFLVEAPDLRAVAPEISYAVASTVRKGMSLEPKRRYPSVADFFDVLERAVVTSRVPVRHRAVATTRTALSRAARVLGPDVVRRLHPRRPRDEKLPIPAGGTLMTTLTQDLRFALRVFTRQPVFTAIAIVTLGLGVGANAAIFSIVNSFLLRPLPYDSPHRIVTIWETNESGGSNYVAGANFVDWRDHAESLEGVAVHPTYAFGGPSTVLGGTAPTRAWVAGVSEDFFGIFRLTALRGRTPLPGGFQAGANPTAFVSERFWRDFLDADPNVTDRALNIGGATFHVVGVAPRGFAFPKETDVWIPVQAGTNPSRTSHNWSVIARLRDDVTLETAQAEMDGIMGRLRAEYGEQIDAMGARLTALQDELVGSLRRPLQLLVAAAGLVLLVACTNIASTLLAQGTARTREFSIRATLGAGRSRIVRQLLAESLVLAALGSLAGLALAVGLVRALTVLAPPQLVGNQSLTVDAAVVGFAATAALLATLIFGLYPALRASRTDIGQSLRAGDRGTAGSHRDFAWRGLVAGEVALAILLLVGSGLLMKSFWRVTAVDPGFVPEGVITVDLTLPVSRYPDDATTAQYVRNLEAAVRQIPDVDEAGFVNHLPLSGVRINGAFLIEGRDGSAGYVDYRITNGGYFAAMGIPLIRGRTFDERDHDGTPHLVVVNQAFVDAYFPNDDPLGKRIGGFANDDFIYGQQWATIVGVVGDVRHRSLTGAPAREIYVHYMQRPARFRGIVATIRTSGLTTSVVNNLRRTMRDLDGDVPFDVSSLENYVSASVTDRRFTMLVLSAFAGVALVLATVGIYGVVSYSVAQRRREMGIRVALGAEPRSVRRLVQGEAMVTVGVGVLLGLAGAFGLTRLSQSLLYDVSPTDPWTFAGVSLVLVSAAWVASFVPAVRSTRVDPMITMRVE